MKVIIFTLLSVFVALSGLVLAYIMLYYMEVSIFNTFFQLFMLFASFFTALIYFKAAQECRKEFHYDDETLLDVSLISNEEKGTQYLSINIDGIEYIFKTKGELNNFLKLQKE